MPRTSPRAEPMFHCSKEHEQCDRFAVPRGRRHTCGLCACAAGDTEGRTVPLPALSSGTGAQADKSGGVLYVDDGGNQAIETFENGTWKKWASRLGSATSIVTGSTQTAT